MIQKIHKKSLNNYEYKKKKEIAKLLNLKINVYANSKYLRRN